MISHVLLELLQVLMLLCQLLLELHELLLLTHADGVVLIGFLALGECISMESEAVSQDVHSAGLVKKLRTLLQHLCFVELQCRRRPWLEWWLRRQLGIGGMNEELGEQLWKELVDT